MIRSLFPENIRSAKNMLCGIGFHSDGAGCALPQTGSTHYNPSSGLETSLLEKAASRESEAGAQRR
ncbi:MAG: hypothetical protein DRP64_17915 [Verrucomicrobia bacterium]|nr:MAG: hypothetical protein DRP64_17915 [Verrucomicrobiota bacterium]